MNCTWNPTIRPWTLLFQVPMLHLGDHLHSKATMVDVAHPTTPLVVALLLATRPGSIVAGDVVFPTLAVAHPVPDTPAIAHCARYAINLVI